MLIAARALLGVAGATLAPSTLSLDPQHVPRPAAAHGRHRRLDRQLLGRRAIGPLVGGVMLEYFWWGSVFLLGVPVMVLLLVLGPLLLPEYRDPDAGPARPAQRRALAGRGAGRDLRPQAARAGRRRRRAARGIVVGVALGVALRRRQRTLADPLIDLRLFRSRAFSASLVTNTLGFFVRSARSSSSPQYLQLVAGLSPLEAGLWSLPSSAGFVVGAMLAPVLLKALRPGHLMAGGLAVAAAGFAMLTQTDGLAVLVAGSVLRARACAGGHAGDGPDRRAAHRPSGRCGVRDLGDERGARRRARHRGARQRRRRDLPLAGGGVAARRRVGAARYTAGGAVAEAQQLGTGGSATRCWPRPTARSRRRSR